MKVANGFAELAALLQSNAHDLVERTIADVRDRAKAHSRVDTGRMRDGWDAEMTGDAEGVVFNPVSYTPANEYGTVHVPAQPMLHPAMDEARADFEAGLAGLLE